MKENLRIYLLAGLVILFSSRAVTAQGIHTSVDKKNILIGEQVRFNLDIDVPSADYTVKLDLPDSVPHFEVLQNTGSMLKDKQGRFSWEQKIVFTSFDSGAWSFPQLNYRINHLNTASQPLATDSFSVNVGYMPIDPGSKPRDINTIIDVSFFDWFWIWMGAGILVLLILLFFLYRYLRRKKVDRPSQGRESAYEEAMKKLAELRKANEEQSLAVKEYHTALADVLKKYYSGINRGNTLNMTSSEILDRLRGYELQAETRMHAAEALQTGDAVKFAKYHATFTENEAALNYLKSVIEEIQAAFLQKP